jgi:hypothetical protein
MTPWDPNLMTWQAGLTMSDIDLYEVNEAFACVPLSWMKALHADPTKLNVNGGALPNAPHTPWDLTRTPHGTPPSSTSPAARTDGSSYTQRTLLNRRSLLRAH